MENQYKEKHEKPSEKKIGTTSPRLSKNDDTLDYAKKNDLKTIELGMGRPIAISNIDLGTLNIRGLQLTDSALWAVRLRRVKTFCPQNILEDEGGQVIWRGLTYRDYDPEYFLSETYYQDNCTTTPLGVSDNHFDQELIFLGGSRNFGHAVFEYLSKSLLMSRICELRGPLPILVYRDMVPSALTFLKTSFPNNPILTMDRNTKTFLENAWVTVAPFRRDINGEIVTSIDSMHFLRRLGREIANVTESNTLDCDTNETPSHKLFFSRSNTSQKRLVNEHLLIPRLIERGFRILDPSDLSIQDQLRLICNAQSICGPIGAATSSTLFAPRTCKIIELVGDPKIFGAYNSIVSSAVLGQPYGRVHGKRVKMEDNKNPSAIFADFEINIDSFLRLIDKVL